MKRLSLLVLMVFAVSQLASPYVISLTNANGPVRDHWARDSFAIQWHMNPNKGGNIDESGNTVGNVIAASFNTWMAAPNASISISRGADTTVTSAGNDGINLICFVCTGDFSEEKETLAVTITTVALSSGGDDGHGGTTRFAGQLLDADMLFNPSRSFSTNGTVSDNVNDLQTVATHEAGHFLGLGHSAVVRAVMFPYSPDTQRTLSYDDDAGIATQYPAGGFTPAVLSGTVRLGGNAVFGAHVYAEPTTTNQPIPNLRRSPVGTLSNPDGTYRIESLPPDAYIVIAEPLDLPVTNDDVDSFGKANGQGAVQTNFTTRWH